MGVSLGARIDAAVRWADHDPSLGQRLPIPLNVRDQRPRGRDHGRRRLDQRPPAHLPGSNSWSTGASMPGTRSFMASAYNPADGRIYLVGGYSRRPFSSVQDLTWAYNPVTDTFDLTRAPIPHAVGGAGSGIITSPTPRMYVVGGRDAAGTVLALNWEYDLAANRWAPRAPAPQPTNVPGGGAYAGRMHIFGGDNPFLVTPFSSPSTWSYDPASNTWSLSSSMNVARSFVAATFVGDTAFAAGGFVDGQSTDVTETTDLFRPAASSTTAASSPPVPPPPSATGATASAGFRVALVVGRR
jgi:Galactose oxidase, central domain